MDAKLLPWPDPTVLLERAMPLTRVDTDQQMQLALDDLVGLGSQVDLLDVEVTGPDQVSFHWSDGGGWPARVLAYDAVSESLARHLVVEAARGGKVVVANQVSAAARGFLSSEGWSWLDRRLGAHIASRDRDIEIRFVPRSTHSLAEEGGPVLNLSRPASDGPIRGRAGIAYAAALLHSPEDPPSFRSIAQAVDMSPTAISNAVKRLAEAGLVDSDSRPTLPELFWTLAEVWQPLKVVAVATLPAPDDIRLNARADRLDGPGWVLGGDLAAAELGAPVVNLDPRPWLWVPTQVELRRAERILGPATWSDRAAVLAVPPTPLVCQRRRPATALEWPLPTPTFAALDLARDSTRGREILAQWTPEGAPAVWR